MGNNKDKQIRDLQKENNKLKAENLELKESLQRLNQSEKELKISKRKQEEADWYRLIKRNTYKDEKRLLVRWFRNLINFFTSLIRMLLLNKKNMKGTHISFLQQKSKASFSHLILSFVLICGAVYIMAPDFCVWLNEYLKQYPVLTNYMCRILRVVVVFTMIFEAKIQYLISCEIDNSHDEEFIKDNMNHISDLISKMKK